MAKLPTRSKLDEIATPDEQKAWLASPVSAFPVPGRKPPELADDKYDERLAYLLNAPVRQVYSAVTKLYIELMSGSRKKMMDRTALRPRWIASSLTLLAMTASVN